MTARRRWFLVAGAIAATVALALVAVLMLLRTGGAPAASPAPAAEAPPSLEPVPAPALEQDRGAPPPPAAPPRRRPPLVVEDHGVKRVRCDAACALEAECGLRDVDACRKASCDGDLRTVNRTDFCIADAASSESSCADVVLCTCDEACWKRGECTGDHTADRRCASTCATLARQSPQSVYVENRCAIESACPDLPACAAVEGARRK